MIPFLQVKSGKSEGLIVVQPEIADLPLPHYAGVPCMVAINIPFPTRIDSQRFENPEPFAAVIPMPFTVMRELCLLVISLEPDLPQFRSERIMAHHLLVAREPEVLILKCKQP